MYIQFDQCIQGRQGLLVETAFRFCLCTIRQDVIIDRAYTRTGIPDRLGELTDRCVIVLLLEVDQPFSAISFLLILIEGDRRIKGFECLFVVFHLNIIHAQIAVDGRVLIIQRNGLQK